MPNDSSFVGEGQVGYMIVGTEAVLKLDEISTVMDERSGEVRILAESEMFNHRVKGQDVDGLRDGYEIAPGSVIVTPTGDFICTEVEDGIATFVRKEAE